MPHYDIKISKIAEQTTKRRTSIELAPTLEKPIYIVTKNMNGRHILELIDCIEKQKIQYQMQQQTSTLGFLLNQRFFVIVDNKYGQVTLGADFASILMTIVGYPKIGKNKKNKYYQRPEQIVKCYRQFIASPDCIKMSKWLIKSNQGIAKVQETPSQMKRGIQVRSIIKYKSQDSKQPINSDHSLKEACKKQSQRLKLIVLQDKTNPEYSAICQSLFSHQKAKDMVQKAENIEDIRKKTLFHTNKVKILYLSSHNNSQELVHSIFIGEVIIFSLNKDYKLNQLINQPKIYAIAYQKNQLLKILYKIGFEVDASKSVLNSYIGNASTFSDSKNSPFLLKNQSNIKQKGMNAVQNEVAVPKIMVKQISIIQNNISIISQANQHSELNNSIMSKGSSCTRKIKRLGKSKSKLKSETSQNEKASPNKITTDEPQRKKKLKNNSNDYYNTTTKSKKNLTFKQNLIEGNPIRKLKSISKVAPQILTFQAQNISTMTENIYNIKSPKLDNSSGSNFGSRSRNSSFASGAIAKPCLNGIFYRQFVPKFHNLAQIIKMKPSSLFFLNEKQAYIQSFVYVKQYDRFVRRIKNRSKELKQKFEQYNFVVILRDEDYAQFEQYCRAKSQYYDEEQAEFSNTLKDNFSVLTKTSAKMNVHVFIQSETDVIHQVISYGKIQVYKYKLLQDMSDHNLERTLFDLKTRVQENCNMINRDQLCA